MENKEKMELKPLLSKELLEDFHKANESMNAFSKNSIIVLSVIVLLVLYVLCLIGSECFLYWVIPAAVIAIIIALRFAHSMNNAGPITQHIQIQLQKRILNEVDIDSLWKSNNKVEVAKIVTKSCIENLEWEGNSIFIPADPFLAMMSTDDLENVEFIQDIENKFSTKFPDSYFNEKNFGDLKFKDVVDYILEHN